MNRCSICGTFCEYEICDKCIEKTKKHQLIVCVNCKKVCALVTIESDFAKFGNRAIFFTRTCQNCSPDTPKEELFSMLYVNDKDAIENIDPENN
ncbi:MAG TPA: hypothetical protein VIR55_12335 [Ignavibacteria bacterium]